MQKALGIIETYGLLAGVTVADTMVKAADVELIGYELAKGQGMTVIKVQGDVGAVKAAIASGEAIARELGLFCAKDIIARPAENLDALVFNPRTVGIVPPPGPESYNLAGKAARPLPQEADQEEAAETAMPPEDEAPAGEAPDNEETPDQAEAEAEKSPVQAEAEAEPEEGAVCNLCGDPACPRKPRQPHKFCIHFEERN